MFKSNKIHLRGENLQCTIALLMVIILVKSYSLGMLCYNVFHVVKVLNK